MKHILTIILLGLSCSLLGQTIPANLTLNDLLKDLEQMHIDGKDTKIVLWFPIEYWDLYARSDPNFDQSTLDYLKNELNDYTIVIAVDMVSMGSGGQHLYQSYGEMKEKIKIVDARDEAFRPLDDDHLSNFLVLLKEKLSPILAQSMGEMGNHANVFFFKTKPSNTNSGLKGNSFRIKMEDVSFKWNLPLACMSVPKTCPVDNEQLPGNFIYCPYHGNKLVSGH